MQRRLLYYFMSEVELLNPEELSELREKAFTRRVALVTALFAVMLAITALGGNNAMKEMLLAQQQSSDQWAFYQSKVMRQQMYAIEKKRLEAELLRDGATMSPKARAMYEDMLKNADDEAKRYADEKKKIEQNAKALEEVRDLNMTKDPYFDYSEVLLQISIVLASISILAASAGVFYFALIAAGLGTVLMINGYLLIFRIPFFH